jgi:hypothetical protein
MACLKKFTPSGSKCRVPAAPITGTLKSPALSDLADAGLSRCELVHNSGRSFESCAGFGPGRLMVAIGPASLAEQNDRVQVERLSVDVERKVYGVGCGSTIAVRPLDFACTG